jgi:uncharacterized protein with PIN domain
MIKLVELSLYKCDRCGKEIKKEEENKPSNLVITDEDFNQETVAKDICEDCMASFWSWYTYNEDFDKLADEISRIETGEK